MNSEAENPTAEIIGGDPMTTIIGGVDLAITLRDGSAASVFVRQMPLKLMGAMSAVIGNESALIELYCDKPAGWADSLSAESASAIADKGQELSLAFYLAWFRRQAKWQEGMMPGSILKLQARIETMVAQAALSTNSASKSQPSIG